MYKNGKAATSANSSRPNTKDIKPSKFSAGDAGSKVESAGYGGGPLEVARDYIARGWSPVPIPYKEKRPTGDGWQRRRITAENVQEHFNGSPANIGIILGPASGGLTDIDLDCPEALAVATRLLPPTGAIFGRKSAPAAHRLYKTTLATQGRAVRPFTDPSAAGAAKGDKAMIVELRMGGERGAQTVFPGSTHKDTGEQIRWESGRDGEPAAIDGDELMTCVERVAAAALLARYWPPHGARHAHRLIVTGFLVRAGFNKSEAENFCRAMAVAIDDEDDTDLLNALKGAYEKHERGEDVAGLPGLMEAYGEKVAKCVAEWVHYDGVASEEPGISPQEGEGLSIDDFRAYMPTHKYIYTPTMEEWPAESVNARIPHKFAGGKRMKANLWLDKHRPIEQMIWAPGRPMLIENRLLVDGGWLEKKGATALNVYRPATITPGDASKVEPWLKHVRRVYPDAADHIIKWLAQRVQRPQEKINHNLVLGGESGVGKDTLLEPLKHAVGPWNFQDISPKDLFKDFNGYVKGVVLRINEAHDLGDADRFSFYERMKILGAAPPDVLRCNEKNRREYYVLNCVGVIITTNHKTSGMYLPADDRRHYVAWTGLSKEDFDGEYWNKIWDWYDDGGYGHVFAYLSSLDLSGFDPKAPPPRTAAFHEIVNAGRPAEDAEISDVIASMGDPDAFTIPDLQDTAGAGLSDWLQDRKNRRAIPHRLEQCGYCSVHNPDAKDGRWMVPQFVWAKSGRGVDGAVAKRGMVIYAKKNQSERDRIKAATDFIKQKDEEARKRVAAAATANK